MVAALIYILNKSAWGYVHNWIFFNHHYEGNVTVVTMGMALEYIVLSKISMSEKEKCHMNLLITQWTKQRNKQNTNRVVDSEDRLTDVRGDGFGKLFMNKDKKMVIEEGKKCGAKYKQVKINC